MAPAAGLGLLLVLALAELAWLGWFLVEPLPNAGNVGGVVRRWVLLGRALPEVIPGVTFRESYLGLAVQELSHVENLPQRVPIALAAGLIAAAAIGLGLIVLNALGAAGRFRWPERLPLAFGVGASGLGAVTLALGRLGLLAPWPVRVGLGALAVGGIIWDVRAAFLDRPAKAEEPSTTFGGPLALAGLLAIVGPFLVLMALGAMLPTIDFDALEYHLQGPKEYYQAGRIAFLPHNVYTSMPFGVEMLHLLGMVVLGDWWRGALVGQLLVMLHAPAAAALVAATARRLGSPRAAWVAAVAYLTTPWVYRLAVIPYVEGPLCYYHAALAWLALRDLGLPTADRPTKVERAVADEVPPRAPVARSSALLLGLLAGGAMACKYPALISAVLPFGAVAAWVGWRERSWRVPLAYAAGVALVIGPWLAKNVVDTGNPVYPLGYSVFGGGPWDAARDAKWAAAHGRRPITAAALAEGLLDVAGRSDWQSPLFTALATLALLRRGSWRASAMLWVYVAYLFATWWLLTHRLDRFWLPLLPALAVLAGLGADWTHRRAWTAFLAFLLGVSILTNLSYTSTALAGLNEWTADLDDLRRRVPEMLNPELASLDKAQPAPGVELPPGSKVLLVGQASVFHLARPIAYNTVFNEETFEQVARGRSPAEVGRALRERGITHVFVDWPDIARYRSPGNYGFTDFVRPEVFAELERASILRRLPTGWGRRELYRVEGPRP